MCDFLLVIHTNLRPILHRLQFVAHYIYWSNFRLRQSMTSLEQPRWGWSPANVRMIFTPPETRMIVLPDTEDRTIVSSFLWIKHRNVTDRRTDRRTDRQKCREYYIAAWQAMRTRCNTKQEQKGGGNCSYICHKKTNQHQKQTQNNNKWNTHK